MRPPRALWVPFEFGRPFGAPDDGAFQRKVVLSALELFERDAGPVLEDFPEDAPGPSAGAEAWVCPVNMSPPPEKADDPAGHLQAVLDEIAALAPWYDMGLQKRGRTTVGVSGLKVEDAARYMASFLNETPDENPRPDLPAVDALKLASEDLRAYYFESAISQPGHSTGQAVFDWFWGETAAARLFLTLDSVLAGSDDKALKFLAERMLIPRAQRDRMSDEEKTAYQGRVDTGSR